MTVPLVRLEPAIPRSMVEYSIAVTQAQIISIRYFTINSEAKVKHISIHFQLATILEAIVNHSRGIIARIAAKAFLYHCASCDL